MFDLKKYIRTIPISDFLSSKDMKEVEAILQKVEYCEIIVVEVNFYPTAKNHIVMQFIVKRLLQIYELINSVCVDSSIYIMANKEVQTMIYQLYKVDE